MPKHAKAAILLILLLVAALVVPLPKSGARGPGYGSDLLHGPVFAASAVLLHRAVRARYKGKVLWSALATWVFLTVLGAATEVVQHFVGRSMSLQDLLANAAGAAAGLSWEVGRQQASRAVGRVLFAAAAAVLLAVSIRPVVLLVDTWRQAVEFPMLASFERRLELSRWQDWECRLRRFPGHATEGQWSLRADLRAGTYPGVGMVWTPREWTGYQELVFDVELDDGPPLDFVVKIEDRQGKRETEDRFERRVRLRPGPNQICVTLSDVAAAPRHRALDLRQVGFFQFFTVRLDRPRTIYLDNVHLR